jgi:hypothetical protein
MAFLVPKTALFKHLLGTYLKQSFLALLPGTLVICDENSYAMELRMYLICLGRSG